MVCPWSDQVIEAMVADNQSTSEIAAVIQQRTPLRSLSSTKRDVERKRNKLATFGTIQHLQRAGIARWGRLPTLPPAASDFLVDLMVATPGIWLDEMQYELLCEFDTWVSLPTISRMVRNKAFTKKVKQTVAGQRSPLLRSKWLDSIREFDPEQLVYLDESAVNEKSMERRHAWAMKGLPARDSKKLRRSERFSVLPAYTIDGWLPNATLIHQGPIDSVMFYTWVRDEVLPHCTPFPGPRSVLVLDNCSTHRNKQLKALCLAHHVLLEFLPPYSPDYNPIELSFHLFKQWMRRTAVWAPTPGDEDYARKFELFLRTAVDLWRKGVNHKALFQRCHVNFGTEKVKDDQKGFADYRDYAEDDNEDENSAI